MKSMLSKLMAVLLLGVGAIPVSHGASLNLGTQPLYLGASIPPLVMLAMSKDQQLYKKAYNDYSDLDGDGQFETTYKHTIDYYGYFDPYKCYSYDATNNWFAPQTTHATKPSTCSGYWSGNFLNWVSMSRIDAVRKLLYGGKRFRDDTNAAGGTTVLERSYLPPDAHSWAKYYLPDTATPTLTPPIDQLTPFNPATTAPTGTAGGANNSYASASVTVSAGNDKYFRNATVNACVGDQVKVAIDATNYMIGFVRAVSGGDCGGNFRVEVTAGGVYGAGSLTTGWALTNLTATGITFCNTTLGSTTGTDSKSQTNTQPPLIRAALGNYALWSANERHQCYRYSETSAPGKGTTPGNGVTRSNGNDVGKSGMASAAMDPPTARNPASGPDFRARVKVCVPGSLGTEKCKQYPDGNYKPIGLLQTYGDDGQLNFGLLSGSYDKNISGGVLRKDIAPFAGDPSSVATSEVKYYTSGSTRYGDGTFSTNNGIVRFLDAMRIYGYYYGDGTYLGGNGDNCNFQLTNITEGNCTSWGNPMSEIYYEGLRYFANAGPTSAYGFTYAGSKEAALSMPQYKSSWANPISQTNYCAPLNMLVFNASVSSNDDNLAAVASSINATLTPAALTDLIGVGEGINDPMKFYFVGRTDSGAANTTTNNELCSAKTINLGSALGICPEGPTLMGSFQISGLAYHAHINKIRTDLTVPTSDTRSLKVNTYGVQLATNVPQIIVPIPGGAAGSRVIIQPAYRLFNSAPQGGGALVDMKIISSSVTPTTATGTIYVNWEDSEQGGDYDQDMWGLIRYTVTSSSVTIETSAIAESTGNPQGFGYIISGTTQDGPHFHSGIENFNFTDPTGGLGCTNCNVGAGWTSRAYTLGAATASALQDPLWYTSKWGGFKELAETGVPATTPNNLPDLAKEWDSKINATGASCAAPPCDGLPDNYFLVSNPLGLETALDKAFVAILTTSSAASVATNSTSLNSGTYVYQARFNPATWSGQLLAYSIDVYGNVASTPAWDASTMMPIATNRKLITANPAMTTGANDAIAFQWANLTAAQQAALNVVPFSSPTTSDTNGASRLAYLRGDQSNEGAASGSFRKRDLTVLGDIANSTPAYVGPPSKFSFDSSYVAFKNANVSRQPVLYAGGNDGMLHAFSVTDGTELLGYVPSQVFSNLNLLTDQSYNQRHRYYVDGSPTVEDAKFDSGAGVAWHTVLVGGLNSGGRGYYALDVTNPSIFSEANASSILLWEFNQSVDTDLGYTYAKPIIAKMANGKMAAIVGNGYNSTSGKAALYIIYLDGGVDGVWSAISATGGINNSTSVSTDYVKLDTGIGSFASPNGMSTVFAADYDGDGLVDYIYGGDLRGNMWKFDVSSATATNWKISFPASVGFNNGSPLFVAKDASNNLQPITTPPEVSLHPNGGLLVFFGTGKYLESTDDQSSASAPFRTQSMYGIWDRQLKNSISGDPNAVPVTGRSLLMVQTAFSDAAAGGNTYRVLTKHQPNYSDVPRTNLVYDPSVDATGVAGSTPAGQRGWYFDFPSSADTVSPSYVATGSGERMVFAPKLQTGRLIYTTLIPSTTPCESGGTSYLMEVNPLTGGRLEVSPLDVNGDGIFNTSDYVTIGGVNVAVAGVKSTIGIIPTPTIIGGAVPGIPGGTGTPGCSGDGCVYIAPKYFCTGTSCTCTDPATCSVCIAPACNLCLQGKCEIKTLSGSSGNLITLREKAGAKASVRISWRELIND